MVQTGTFPLNWYEPQKPLPDSFGHYPMSRIVAYCAEEVRRQRDTQWHVYRMFDAWSFAMDYQRSAGPALTHAIVREIGARVDERGEEGYRSYEIYITGLGHQVNERIGAFPQAIHFKMENLLERQNELSPEIWYYEFEKIHPFGDGNGRTGKILYNWLNGTLDNPVWPPDFFGGIENP
jgi:hypothetical protein